MSNLACVIREGAGEGWSALEAICIGIKLTEGVCMGQ